MRPSSIGEAAYCVALCLTVRLSVRPVMERHVAPPSELQWHTCRTVLRANIQNRKLRFSLMGQRHVCTFRHGQRAAYRTAISAAQILVSLGYRCSLLYNTITCLSEVRYCRLFFCIAINSEFSHSTTYVDLIILMYQLHDNLIYIIWYKYSEWSTRKIVSDYTRKRWMPVA